MAPVKLSCGTVSCCFSVWKEIQTQGKRNHCKQRQLLLERQEVQASWDWGALLPVLKWGLCILANSCLHDIWLLALEKIKSSFVEFSPHNFCGHKCKRSQINWVEDSYSRELQFLLWNEMKPCKKIACTDHCCLSVNFGRLVWVRKK